MKERREAWVTHASDDKSATNALIVLQSLRRALTSRNIVVVVTGKVSEYLKTILEVEFDHVYECGESDIQKVDALPVSENKKSAALCWKLPVFQKCIYIHPSCVVLKNIDYLFEDNDPKTKQLANVRKDSKKLNSDDLTLFMFKPGVNAFRNILENCCNIGLESSSNVLNAISLTKTVTTVNLNGSHLTQNEDELRIIHFEQDTFDNDNLNCGDLEKEFLELRQNLYREVQDVLLQPHEGDKPSFYVKTKELLDAPSDPIAIVGMSCRYPGANNLPEFWRLLIDGKDAITQVTSDRWTREQGCNPTQDTKTTQAGFLSCPVDEFDGKFFGISPMELSYLDPQQRIMLEVIWESLEDACIDAHKLKGTYTGIFMGEWTNDYKELLREQGNKEFYRTYMGNSPGSGAGRISFILGTTGPSVATESGCSSAMVAVDLACKSLRLGETKLAIAAGVNLLLHPFSPKEMSMVCAPDGHCKTFDANADGFGRAEGCGSLVLKRYSEAVNDGDKIWAVIRGSGLAQEGPSKSLGTPTVNCEALAMRRALTDAGVLPQLVSYVETHGTGTPVGDPMEVAAIAKVYSENRDQPLTIGSVKTNVGHTESCSGITGIMKVVLSLQNQMIPPHRNFQTLNPHVNLNSVPAEIPLQAKNWPSVKPGCRYAGVSSFGITGTDGHIIIQDDPGLKVHRVKLTPQRPLHLLTISAKNDEALQELLGKYQKFLSESAEEFANIAHTANAGRAHLQQRVFLMSGNTEDALKRLENQAYLRQQVPEHGPGKLCFLFTGQGSQYPGMTKTLYETSPIFKLHFDKCEAILRNKYHIDIKSVMWPENSSSSTDHNANDISRTIYSQTSIFIVEYCMTKLWESFGVRPDFVLGHSLGEFAAACAAGIIEFEDALMLVAERSRLIDALPTGQMIAVKASKKTVDDLLTRHFEHHPNDPLDYAAINSSNQIVLAGTAHAVEQFSILCLNNHVKTHILSSSHAFHSRSMDPMLNEYRQVAASKVKHSETNGCRYVSGLDGKVVGEVLSEMNNEDYWIRHTRECVRFLSASKAAYEEGCRLYLEVGPHPVLSALTMINCGDLGETIQCLPSIRRNEEEWSTLLTSLGKLYLNGVAVNWEKYDQYYGREKVMGLPQYPFQRKRYWFETRSDFGGMINGLEIHPLIGCPLPNATATKIFQSNVELKKIPYIKDHCIGSRVIFPAAGYMEIVLAAGHAATQCCVESIPTPGTPLTVESLLIEAPLGMNENESCQFQILASADEMSKAGYKVMIHRRIISGKDNLSSTKWVKHAQGDFFPYCTDDSDYIGDDTLEKIQQRCSAEYNLDKFYQALWDIGLKFGDTFKSIVNIHLGENELVGTVKIPDCGSEDYLCHPVLIDAMIQSLLISRNEGKSEKLVVPVSIKRFTWYKKLEAEESSEIKGCFIHCQQKNGLSGNAETQATLYDAAGSKLAVMTGAELIETTVDTIISALEQQKLSLPNLYEEAWRPVLGPLEGRVEPLSHSASDLVTKDLNGSVIQYDKRWNEEEAKVSRLSDRLTYLYLLRALLEMGWDPALEDQIQLESFMTKFGIVNGQKRLIQHFFNGIMVEEGVFKCSADDSWIVKKVPPKTMEINSEISSIHSEIEIHRRKDMQLLAVVGDAFGSIMIGKESPLGILFPDDPTKVSADVFYSEANISRSVNLMAADVLSTLISKYQNSNGKDVIRILEVGGGTGSCTKYLLPIIAASKFKYEYTFTDISQMFFNKAGKGFEEYATNMKYKVLNIEVDPKSQGFIPNYYDIIIASNVLHATRNLQMSVQNIRHLLRESGLFLLAETNRSVRHLDMIFGVLEGYWLFEDFDLRPNHTVVSREKWEKLLIDNNFQSTSSISCYNEQQSVIIAKATSASAIYYPPISTSGQSNVWIVFTYDSEHQISKFLSDNLVAVGKSVVTITPGLNYERMTSNWYRMEQGNKSHLSSTFEEVLKEEGSIIEGILYLWGIHPSERDQLKVSKSFLDLSQILLSGSFKKFPRCYVITQGIMPISDQEPFNPSAGTLWGLTRSLRSEQANLTCRCIDISPKQKSDLLNLQELFMELWNEDEENQVAYRNSKRYVVRFIATKLNYSDLTIPNTSRFGVTLPSTKTFADMKFDVRGKQELKDYEIELRVKAAALNFRDVFNVLKPDEQFENSNSVAADFAGIITDVGPKCTKWQIGDYVVGCNFDGGALPSHVKTLEDAVVALPERLTFAEGCTLPAVFATAYYCLKIVGRLQAGETILIHTASGGVGICAIQLAKWIGANVIVTAGSKRKRAYLRNLGLDAVFHSRDLTFGEEIMRVTKGKGVNMVLNSITGPGFKETSLKSCAKNARFVEMSKLSIFQPEEVAEIRPDVEYTIVDLIQVSKETWKMLFNHLSEFLEKEKFRPVPYVRFNAVNIREALTYLQKAKHVGKVVCIMPEMELVNGEYTPKTEMFNDRSTYIITGGLGGIGIEVAKWMASSGAQHIVLVARNPPGEIASTTIQKLRDAGKNIVVENIDVGDFEQCRQLIDKLSMKTSGLPQIRGVMHAAGCLSDAIIVNQTWEKFQKTFNAKVKGGWNLHELTKDFPLEHFVMFSSVVALFGPLGQSNHAASNSFLDALTHYRISLGLPAMTINWGQWGQVGVAAGMEVAGLVPFSPTRGIAALEAIMKAQRNQISVLEADFPAIRRLFPQTKKYVEELRLLGDAGMQIQISSDKFWQEYDNAENESEKYTVVQNYIANILRQILKLDKNEHIDENQNLQEMGLDSLMMVEMKNFLQTLMGNRVTVSASALQDCHNLAELTGKIVDLVEGSDEDDSGIPQTKEELNDLIHEDAVLPDNIQATEVKPVLPSEVKTILVTGCTGNLGPYLVSEASKLDHINKIYCLIRPHRQISPKDRLYQRLKEKNLLESTALDKIHYVEGSLSEGRFGLGEEAYLSLADDVEAIIHSAVKSNHVEKYRKPKKPGRDIRTTNVVGTLRLLEFATTGRTKLFMHSSSLVAITKSTEPGKLPEHYPSPSDFDNLPNVGYGISKFICDRFMHQATEERQLPVKSLRFPAIAGDSRSGHHSLQDNHLMLRVLSYMKMGVMPSLPAPMQYVSVDICAKIAVRLMFDDNVPFDVYNVTNPRCPLEHDFIPVADKLGFKILPVDYSEFIKRLEAEGENSLLFPLKDLYFNEETFIALSSSPELIQDYMLQVALKKGLDEEFFRSQKLQKYVPDIIEKLELPTETIQRDLLYARNAGVFKKLGLENEG